MNPPQPWRTSSIFISSTFADMQAERDHLKTIVFPKIEEELRKKRITLEIVDLRWRVDTASVNEADRGATVLKVVWMRSVDVSLFHRPKTNKSYIFA